MIYLFVIIVAVACFAAGFWLGVRATVVYVDKALDDEDFAAERRAAMLKRRQRGSR